MTAARIILIDDNKQRQAQFSASIEFLEYQPALFNSDDFADSFSLLDDSFAVFIGGGLAKQAEVLKKLSEQANKVPLIFLFDKGGKEKIPKLAKSLQASVQEWPVPYSELVASFQMLKIQSSASALKSSSQKALVGSSDEIAQVCFLISQVAKSDSTVLILGESGTGKELVARALHQESARKDQAFVPINCGAIPAELLESELFGHEKGAFTGALASRKGRFEMAEGGTLFLDEIGDMPLPMQVKLLRVLQERTYERVGGNKTLHCNVRIISATHRNIEAAIEKDLFRQDLFYRLNVFPIELPALRERSEDISFLIDDLIARAKQPINISFTAEVIHALTAYQWPGNVRELANLVERLSIIKPNACIELTDLPKKMRQQAAVSEVKEDLRAYMKYSGDESEGQEATQKQINKVVDKLPETGVDLKEYLHGIELSLIQQALDECNGVVAHAAKKLNMRRTTLVEKLKKLEL